MEFALERNVVEDLLQDALSVIESAFDGDAVDIFVRNCRHLAFLKRRNAPLGEHDEDIDASLATDAMNGGAACVAAGGSDDVQPVAAFGENVLKDVAEEL